MIFIENTFPKAGRGFGKGMPLDIAGGWNKSNGLNRPGLERLVGNLERGQPIGGRVGEFLPGLDQHDPRRAVVGKLVAQIRQMWQDKSYMLGSNEPYEMIKRLAVLSSMVDGQVFWNRKSVKQDTGNPPAVPGDSQRFDLFGSGWWALGDGTAWTVCHER